MSALTVISYAFMVATAHSFVKINRLTGQLVMTKEDAADVMGAGGAESAPDQVRQDESGRPSRPLPWHAGTLCR